MTNEQIGFHKGAITTLANEKKELLRLMQIVDSLIHMHVKSLKDLGIDITKDVKKGLDERIK